MRIIKESRVKQFIEAHPEARSSLERWARLSRKAQWTKFQDVRSTFPDADEVRVVSGHKAMVFDINGNDFRLIAAVHYMRVQRDEANKRLSWTGGRIYVFYFLTHPQYDEAGWKETL